MDNLSIEQKFAKMLIDLRKIRPFESALYETIDKKESNEIDTLAVTHDSILYNREFVDSLEYEVFKFWMLHEMYHIALQHVIRKGDRDGLLWNVACDLYVNKLLSEEFGLDKNRGINFELGIKMPRDILYNQEINTDTDCVEQIYQRLIEQTPKNGYNENGTGTFSLSPNNDSDDNENNGLGVGRQPHNIRSKDKIEINANDKTEFIDTGEDASQKEYESRRILSDAKTKYEMENAEANIGNSPGGLYINVKDLLKSKLDWKKLLRKYCIALKSTDTSFNSPDSRMYYQKFIYPGKYISEENALKDVKICFDTSGSISQEDFKYFIGQVKSLVEQYKTNAELICWDATMQSTYDFEGIQDIFSKGLAGGGGTDPTCIFKYFDSKECKQKPKVTLVFTDGFFYVSGFKPKWYRKYKDTIWVMTRSYNRDFEPPFGKIAVAEFK